MSVCSRACIFLPRVCKTERQTDDVGTDARKRVKKKKTERGILVAASGSLIFIAKRASADVLGNCVTRTDIPAVCNCRGILNCSLLVRFDSLISLGEDV